MVSIAQIFPIFYFSFFSFKLLTRSRNRSTLILSAYFIINVFVFTIAAITILLVNTPFSQPLYFISYYLYTFSHAWLIILSWILIYLPKRVALYKLGLVILLYALLSTHVFWIGICFDGISYGVETGWRPEFSWLFLAVAWTYFFFCLVIPQFILSRKVLGSIEDEKLNKRIKMFIFAVYANLADAFLLVLYNTWIDNQIYRSIHIFIALPLIFIATYFSYRSFGKDLT